MSRRGPPSKWLFETGFANPSRTDDAAMAELRRKNRPDPDLMTVLALVPELGSIELDDLIPRSPFDARKTHLLLAQLVCAKTVLLRRDELARRTTLRRQPPKEP